MMKKVFLTCLLALMLFFIIGCSASFYQQSAQISEENISQGPYRIEIIRKSDGTNHYSWNIESRIEQAQTIRIKYHDLWHSARFMVVEGRIGNSRKSYPVVLDTGASQSIFVQDAHVKQNKLDVYPITTSQVPGFDCRLCHLPELCLGDIKLVDWPSFYLKSVRFMPFKNFKTDENETIIVGLPVIRQFKYIMFDDINREMEFSSDTSFVPHPQQTWQKYTISIEEDFCGNMFLFVDIPVNGLNLQLQLDTGSGKGLALREDIWQQFSKGLAPVKLSRSNDFFPYIGKLSCRKTVLHQLKIGNNIVENTEVSVFPQDCPLFEECGGLLGMQCFQDTIFVLDFEHSLLWIKNTGSRLNSACVL